MGGRIQNLRPWPKGVSGNPAGRPKGDIASGISRAIFEHNAEAIYQGMLKRLKKGDARAFKVLADRAYGKVKENVELEVGANTIVERLEAGHQRMVASMSEAEIDEEIRRLERKLGLVRVQDLKSSDVGEVLKVIPSLNEPTNG